MKVKTFGAQIEWKWKCQIFFFSFSTSMKVECLILFVCSTLLWALEGLETINIYLYPTTTVFTVIILWLYLWYIILLIYLLYLYIKALGVENPKKLISVVCHWHTIPDIIYWYVLRRKCFCWPEYYLFFVIIFFITESSS